MFKSILKEEFEIDETRWVVSIFMSQTNGRPFILLEGCKEGKPVVYQFSINSKTKFAINSTSKTPDNEVTNISAVIISNSYFSDRRDYQNVKSKSWYVTPDAAANMIEDIQNDFEMTENAKMGSAGYLFCPCNRVTNLFDDHQTVDNIPNWYYEKLEIVGIDIPSLNMSKSIINDAYEFNEERWVVSIFNSAMGSVNKFAGHSVLLLEGYKNNNRFIRQCDIIAEADPEYKNRKIGAPFINIKGRINDIRVFEDYHSDLSRYKKVHARSWYVSPVGALEMMQAIYKDQQQTENAKLGLGDYLPYQLAGRYSLFGDQKADNCSTWCYQKLILAGAHITVLPFDKIKAAPEKHVKAGASFLESSLEAESCRLV